MVYADAAKIKYMTVSAVIAMEINLPKFRNDSCRDFSQLELSHCETGLFRYFTNADHVQ